MNIISRIKKPVVLLRRIVDILLACQMSILRQEYTQLLSDDRYADPRCLTRFGYSNYSQADEDGIIKEIFRRIGTKTRSFVEFGTSNGLESNAHALILEGWSGLWIDGSRKHVDEANQIFSNLSASGKLSIVNAFLTPNNINEIISQRYSGEIDLLSVDIDGNDFHVLKALDCINPRLIVAEYNARKGPTIDWVMTYNDKHTWKGSDYFGASLHALELLLKSKGYLLVGCSISGVNGFFVREDLVSEDKFLPPFTSIQHYEPQRKLLRLGVNTSHDRDYGPWTSAKELLELDNQN